MTTTSPPHCQTRDAAMVDASLSYGEPQRPGRTRDDRGMTAPTRTTSPPAVSVAAPAAAAAAAASTASNRSHDYEHRPEESHLRQPRDRSIEKPQQSGPRRRQRSRGRSRDRPNRPPHQTQPFWRRPRPDSRDRGPPLRAHDSGHPVHFRPPGPRGQGGPRRDSSPPHPPSLSPPPAKRARSPGSSVGRPRPRRGRRDRSPRRRGPGPPRPQHPPKFYRDNSPPPRGPRSPNRRGRFPHPGDGPGRPDSASPPPRHSLSPSPNSPHPPSRDHHQPPPFFDRPRHRHQSPSLPPPGAYPRSRSPHLSRSPRGSRPPTSSDTASRRRPSPPPRSPRDPRRPKVGRKGRGRDGVRQSRKFDPSSGANSIEVNMSARGGGYRGGYNPPLPPAFHGAHDSRVYSHSSGHATPNSSHHGSPRSQSPFGGGGRSWSNQQQYSPQQQYPPQYPHYGTPNGSQSHFYPNQGPPYSPHGDAPRYSQGPYRDGHRGPPAGARANQYGSGRSGGRAGAFKNTHWTSNAPPADDQGSYGTGDDEAETSHLVPSQPSPDRAEREQDDEDAGVAEGENPFRPSRDLQVEDTVRSDAVAEESQMPPPSRPAAAADSQTSSSASSKFSFAFKASKPAVATPKPEISSKFNAPPPRREAPPPPPPPPPPRRRSSSRESERDRPGFPRNVPTEPASARPRSSDRPNDRPNDRRPPPMEPMPRTRKVKKTMKRPKPRPILPPDLAASDSVFFRKPGNESVIGSGTYGKVFKGVNVYTKKLVALKRIRMEGERDGFPVTAVREIKLLQSLKHTNIVNLQEVMVEKNDCFMVFEYLSHDLTGLLNHPTFKLDAAQRKHLALQMFQGLDYLHKRGVLHRDIKAANILVSNDGILKLADFGLARFYAKRHQLDYTNRVITIWYRSPELLLGETQYGAPVDIWSAACVMFEIFTRHALFPGDGSEISQLDRIHAVLGTPNKAEWPNLIEMPWFELLRPGYRKPNVFREKYRERLPAAAFELLAAALCYDPAKRPTAAEVLEHPYFTSEYPPPRQAVELETLDGDWHEFESKALRRENERREREAKRGLVKEAGAVRDKDRKRPIEAAESQRESKRPHVHHPKPPQAPPSQQPDWGTNQNPNSIIAASTTTSLAADE